MQRLACHFCFRAGSIPGLAGPWVLDTQQPPAQLNPWEDWQVGVLQALTEGLQEPREYFPLGYNHLPSDLGGAAWRLSSVTSSCMVFGIAAVSPC